MFTYRLPSQFAAARRALAWAAVVISGVATLGLRLAGGPADRRGRSRRLRRPAEPGRAARLLRPQRRRRHPPGEDRRRLDHGRGGPGGLGLSPAGRRRRGVRRPRRPDPPRREDPRRPVLRDRQRRHRPRVPARAAGRRRPRRARPHPGRRPVRHRPGRAVRRPGRARQRRGPPVQPAAGARRRLRAAHRVLAAPVLAHQPPDAQQAVHRRRQLRRDRRPQHRRRVLRSQRRRQLHRHGPAVERPGRRQAGRGVRRLLELGGRVPDRQPDRRRLRATTFARQVDAAGNRRHRLAPSGAESVDGPAGRRPGRAGACQRRGDRRRARRRPPATSPPRRSPTRTSPCWLRPAPRC